VIALNNAPIIMEEAAVAVVVTVVVEVAVVVVAAVEAIVIDAKNRVILHVIVLNRIHVVDKAVVQEINKVEMMMKIR